MYNTFSKLRNVDEAPKQISLDDAKSSIGTGRAHYILLVLIAGGYLATCSELLLVVFSVESVASLWSIDKQTFAWLPFCTSIVGLFGGGAFGVFSDKNGRRLPFIVWIGFSAVFSLASAFAPNFIVFVILRSCVSFGNGGAAVDFVVFSEFLPRKSRGKLMVLVTLSGTLGVAYTAGTAWLLVPNNKWHLFVIVCAIPFCVNFVLRLLISFESPVYLTSRGRKDKALQILKRIASLNNCPDVLDGYELISQQEQKPLNFLHLFSKEFAAHTLKITAIWILQVAGYWGVTVFFPVYLSEFGLDQYFCMFINICANIPGHFLLIILIDRPWFGRIRTLRIFSSGAMISLLLTALLQDEVSISVLAVFTYFFMIPIFAILQTYTTETYPTLLRNTAMSWALMMICIPGMTTAFIGAELVSSDKKWLYPLVWGLVFVLQLLVSLTLNRETAGGALDETAKEESKDDDSNVI